MVESRPSVVRASQAAAPVPRIGAAAPVAQPTQTPVVAPEPKRSKSEHVHEGRGWWAGFSHGLLVGLCAGIGAMFFAFLAGVPILADLTARLTAINDARAHLGR